MQVWLRDFNSTPDRFLHTALVDVVTTFDTGSGVNTAVA